MACSQRPLSDGPISQPRFSELECPLKTVNTGKPFNFNCFNVRQQGTNVIRKTELIGCQETIIIWLFCQFRQQHRGRLYQRGPQTGLSQPVTPTVIIANIFRHLPNDSCDCGPILPAEQKPHPPFQQLRIAIENRHTGHIFGRLINQFDG